MRNRSWQQPMLATKKHVAERNSEMTDNWSTTFQQALTGIDPTVKAPAEDFTENQMSTVRGLAYSFWLIAIVCGVITLIVQKQ
jgi:hypothetical protein